MKERTKLEIYELKLKKHEQQDGICLGCGGLMCLSDNLELAHILKQGKLTKKYTDAIIHHPLNMHLTHSQCNSKVQMNTNKTVIVEAHVKMIREAIERGE